MYGNRDFGGPRTGFSPVKVGEELDVKIEGIGKEGDGIAKEKGFVLFIPGAKEGDEVRIKVNKVLRNVGFAEVVGKAQGPISSDKAEASDADAPEESQDTEDSGEEEKKEEVAEDPQDSEDFGEEEKMEEAEDAGEAKKEPQAEDTEEEEETAEKPKETTESEEETAEEPKETTESEEETAEEPKETTESEEEVSKETAEEPEEKPKKKKK